MTVSQSGALKAHFSVGNFNIAIEEIGGRDFILSINGVSGRGQLRLATIHGYEIVKVSGSKTTCVTIKPDSHDPIIVESDKPIM